MDYFGESFTEFLDSGVHFLLHDSSIFFGLVLSLEAHPGEFALSQVHQHVPDRLQVIAPTLFLAYSIRYGTTAVSVDTRITSSADDAFLVGVGDMLPLVVPEVLGQPKVNEVQCGDIVVAYHDVFWLDVPVYEVLRVERCRYSMLGIPSILESVYNAMLLTVAMENLPPHLPRS